MLCSAGVCGLPRSALLRRSLQQAGLARPQGQLQAAGGRQFQRRRRLGVPARSRAAQLCSFMGLSWCVQGRADLGAAHAQ